MRNELSTRPRYHFLDQFLRLMFPPASAPPPARQQPLRPVAAYRSLPVTRLGADAGYHVPDWTLAAPVRNDSAALEVMTDLRRVEAVTIGLAPPVHIANQTMIAHGVRALLVVDAGRRLCGIVTAIWRSL